jgi:hypothetical protein
MKHKDINNLSSPVKVKTSLVLDEDSIHFEDGRIYTIDGIDTFGVEDLIINYLNTTSFDTTPFPNLKSLRICTKYII